MNLRYGKLLINEGLADQAVEPSIALNWIIGFIAAFFLFAVIARVIESFNTEAQQWSVTGIAVTNGLVLSLGLSPFGDFASEMAQLFELIPSEYPGIVGALITIETAFTLLWGLWVMWDSGKTFAVLSFSIAFVGGVMIPYSPALAVMLIMFGWLAMMASPADRW